MKIEQVLIEPVLTEKATKLSAVKVYMFSVSQKATKSQIRQALKNLYSVDAVKVTISKRKGKMRRTGRKLTPKRTSGKKIAYVKIKSGTIDVFPQT